MLPTGAPQRSEHDELWPSWTPLIETAIAVFLAALVASEPRTGWSVGARIVVAAIPAIVWFSCAAPWRPPFLVRAAMIFGAVAALVWHPAKFDAAPFFLVVLIGEACVVAPGWQSIVVTAASAALLAGLDLAGRFDGAVVWVLAFAFTWSGVALLQSRLRLVGEIGERAAYEERQRIARELHDVIAHSLAVTMLHLTGARLALERDPADAAQALLEAERLGRQSLAEIRRTVGLLAPTESAPGAAMPTAVDISDLVREVTDAGLEVDFECEGDLRQVPPAAGLSLYRVVQESLANTVKHAPGAAAHVRIRVDDEHMSVDVRNLLVSVTRAGRRSEDPGMGLALMRERTELLGGTLRAGPDGGHWHVRVAIPTKLPA
jgi:signal transduction histidine kinase